MSNFTNKIFSFLIDVHKNKNILTEFSKKELENNRYELSQSYDTVFYNLSKIITEKNFKEDYAILQNHMMNNVVSGLHFSSNQDDIQNYMEKRLNFLNYVDSSISNESKNKILKYIDIQYYKLDLMEYELNEVENQQSLLGIMFEVFINFSLLKILPILKYTNLYPEDNIKIQNIFGIILNSFSFIYEFEIYKLTHIKKIELYHLIKNLNNKYSNINYPYDFIKLFSSNRILPYKSPNDFSQILKSIACKIHNDNKKIHFYYYMTKKNDNYSHVSCITKFMRIGDYFNDDIQNLKNIIFHNMGTSNYCDCLKTLEVCINNFDNIFSDDTKNKILKFINIGNYILNLNEDEITDDILNNQYHYNAIAISAYNEISLHKFLSILKYTNEYCEYNIKLGEIFKTSINKYTINSDLLVDFLSNDNKRKLYKLFLEMNTRLEKYDYPNFLLRSIGYDSDMNKIESNNIEINNIKKEPELNKIVNVNTNKLTKEKNLKPAKITADTYFDLDTISLNKKTKEKLKEICDNYNISYKYSSTKPELVNMISDYLKNKYISRVIKNTDLKDYNVPQLKILCKFNNLYYKCKIRRNELEDMLAEKIKSSKKYKFKSNDMKNYTIFELKEICDTYKIYYLSTMKKDDIINLIINDERIIKFS